MKKPFPVSMLIPHIKHLYIVKVHFLVFNSGANSIGSGTDVRVRSVLVLNKSAAKLTGRLTPPRHPRRSAPSGAETSTRPSSASLHKLPFSNKTRRGRAGAAAEPLCASPRFRPLFPFSFRAPMALIIGIIFVACTRLIFYSPQVILGNSRG